MMNSPSPNSTLEEWIEQLLLLPTKELNRKYNLPPSDAVSKEVESLPGVGRMNYRSCRVSDAIIHQLHQKIRGQKCEAILWDNLLPYLRDPLPTQVAHDLIDRNIVVSQLGHTRQHDEVQWRLASLVDEALLTFVWDMFNKPSYLASDLQRLLDLHADNLWLLNNWENWLSAQQEPGERWQVQEQQTTDFQKEIIFHRWAWQHPERSSVVPAPERYLEMMAEKEERKKLQQLRLQHQAQEEEHRAEERRQELERQAQEEERRAEERRRELERLAQTPLESAKIEGILEAKDPDELLALSRNPHAPIHYIEKLVNCYQIKGSRQIREAAQNNIQARASIC